MPAPNGKWPWSTPTLIEVTAPIEAAAIRTAVAGLPTNGSQQWNGSPSITEPPATVTIGSSMAVIDG